MRGMVMRQVRNAFKVCGDLLVDVTLVPKHSESFDMETMSADVVVPSSFTGKCIFMQETKLAGAVAEITLIAEDVPNVSVYSTANINGKSWKIVEPIINDSYLIRMGLN